MKKTLIALILFTIQNWNHAQEIQANVQVNHNQLQGSNTQVFKTLEKSLSDFINNTSWTGAKYQNFGKKSKVILLLLSLKDLLKIHLRQTL